MRSLLLGAAVWALLKLLRLRDSRTETLVWTMVLAASLFMPLLVKALPGGIALPLFSFFDFVLPATSAGIAPAFAAGQIGTLPNPDMPAWAWLQTHAAVLLWSLYGLPAMVGLARLTTGLALTARLYARAVPIAADWALGRPIRTSATISGPISFGRCILLPPDYTLWSPAKLRAVLAHEQSHVRRGDFFILLLAALYRALFWFSPFAWWLQARLSALAEVESDEAAIRVLDDRTSYAEILIDISRRARSHSAPGLYGPIAMAKGPDIHWRVDRILDGTPERNLPRTVRLLAGGAILPAALLVASAHAAVPPLPSTTLPLLITRQLAQPFSVVAIAADTRPAANATAAAHRSRLRATAASRAKTQAAAPQDEVSYNPRALLEDPVAILLPALVPTDGKHKKSAGDAAIILNLNSFAGSGE